MGRIAIVTDSSACVPVELVERYNIHVVPVLLIFGKQTFRDGVDITPKDFYRMLQEAETLPTSSVPSIGDFLRVYTRLSEEAEGIVSIHLSPELSVLHDVALTAAKMVEDVPVQVIDCRTAAAAQGFVVLEAARAAAKGAHLLQVVERVKSLIPKMNLFVTLDTLKYIHRSGRVPGVAALVGSVLKISPIIYLEDGKADVFAKPRTKARAVRRMLELMGERVGSRPVHAAVMHADALDEANRLRDEVASRFNCVELYVTEFTPVMGAHTGPGLLGVAFWAEEVNG